MSQASLNISIPAELGSILSLDQSGNALPRWAVEAILVEAVREGKVSRGFFRKVLNLQFQVAEELLASRGVTYDMSIEELERDARAVASDKQRE